MYNMDLENGNGGGGGAANNLQQQVQLQHQEEEEEEEEEGGVLMATPDPAGDYLTCCEIGVMCVLGVVLSSLGALLIGMAFTTIPCTMEGDSVVFDNAGDARAFLAELASGLVALGLGCVCAAVLALRCCRGSHSSSLLA